MADLISTDHPLTTAQQRVLSAVLETLVPAGHDGRLPSAAEVGFADYLLAQAEDFIPDVAETLEQLDERFATLAAPDRTAALTAYSNASPQAFQQLLARVYDCYYQDDRVRSAIGMLSGAPFPQGNTIPAGDLSLLDPLVADEARHRYRET